jgi:hypothetical protein
VSHSIFQDILQKGLLGDIRIEGYYQQYKMLQANDGEDIKARKKLLEIKYSKEMLEFIRKYFEEYEFVLTDLKYSGQLILSAEDLSRKVARVTYGSFKRRYEGVEDTIRKLYEDYFAEHKEEIYEGLEEKVQDYISQQELEVLYVKTKKQVIHNALERLKERNKLDGATQLLQIVKAYETYLCGKDSGALGMYENILKNFGPDSYIGRCASVIMGSTETTFYAITLYYGSINIKKTRHTLPSALCADITSFILSPVMVNLFF